MADVKSIKVNNTSYNVKDTTARTMAGRVNVTKSDNNLVFTDSNGANHTIPIGDTAECPHYVVFSKSSPIEIRGYNLKTGAHDGFDSSVSGQLNLGDMTINVSNATTFTWSTPMDVLNIGDFSMDRNVTAVLSHCALIYDR